MADLFRIARQYAGDPNRALAAAVRRVVHAAAFSDEGDQVHILHAVIGFWQVLAGADLPESMPELRSAWGLLGNALPQDREEAAVANRRLDPYARRVVAALGRDPWADLDQECRP